MFFVKDVERILAVFLLASDVTCKILMALALNGRFVGRQSTDGDLGGLYFPISSFERD